MKTFLQTHRRHILVAATLFAVAALYSLLSFGNHLMFRTFGLDLGLYTNALYDYAHLRSNDSSFFLWQPANLLADHFDLYLVLLSPLVWLFGAYTLLVVQIVAVLVGMLGMYRLSGLYTDSLFFRLLSMFLLGLSFGVWHALGFDYHSNVVGALLLPYLVYFLHRRKVWSFVCLAFLMALPKETSALWMCFVLVALLFDVWKDRPMRRVVLSSVAGCALWFLLVSLLIMPSLGKGSGFWRYEWMGSNVGEMVRWMLAHPFQAVSSLFVDFAPPLADNFRFKKEFYICAAASGMLLVFLRPNYLLMLIPPFAMKMLAADPPAFWGITNHYNIELCVVSAVAAVSVLGRIHRTPLRSAALFALLLLTVGTLLYTTRHPQTPIRQENLRVFSSAHYSQPDFDASAARRMLKEVPPRASVCATTIFTPHLAVRDSSYIFPMGMAYGAEYWLLLLDYEGYYRMDDYDEASMAASLVADTAHYEVLDSEGSLFLLRARRN